MARILLHNDPNPTLTLVSYCCPTRACYCPTNPTSPMPIRIRTNKPRCRYAYETTPITRHADTPTTSITYHADMPMTRTRLGRACSLDTRTRRLHRTATRPVNKTSRCYACDTTLITRRADTPTTPSLAPYYHPEPTSLVLIRLRAEHN